MFECMFASEVKAQLSRPTSLVAYDHVSLSQGPARYRYELSDWNIAFPPSPQRPRKLKLICENRIKFRKLLRDLEGDTYDHLTVSSALLRMEYYPALDRYRSLFLRQNTVDGDEGGTSDELVIHVRTGDVLVGAHPDYMPLPLEYYRALIIATSLRPVFIGQLDRDWYSAALQSAFPNARFLRGRNRLDDFEFIRNSVNIATSVSSFSWLAAWLSRTARKIVLPVAGFLNPLQRADIDLLPRDDARYEFYRFPILRFQPSTAERLLLTDSVKFERCSPGELPRFSSHFTAALYNKTGILL